MPRKTATDKRWDEAVDWLINRAEMEAQRLFWAYVDGKITLDELDTLTWRDVEERETEGDSTR